MNTAEKARPPKKVIFRLVACSAILLLGAAGMVVLDSMKKARPKYSRPNARYASWVNGSIPSIIRSKSAAMVRCRS